MPGKLKKGVLEFTEEQAVDSRKVTQFRGVIERFNRSVKRFGAVRLRAPSARNMDTSVLIWRAGAILCNRFFAPLAKMNK